VNLPFAKKKAWFHVSSLGELEQAYPLIQAVKEHQYTTVVSFFSHSGYDYGDRYPAIDHCFLLPLDTASNGRRFVQDIKADIVFWTKNDFWLNTLNAIIKERTPVILFAASFYEDHFIQKPIFSTFRETLSKFEQIFVQNENSLKLLANCKIHNASVSGDTRISRVKQRAQSIKSIKGLQEFSATKPVLALASVHEEDSPIIKKAILAFKDIYKIIIIPHHIEASNISKIMNEIPDKIYEINDSFASAKKEIIVFNKMGDLFDMYVHTDIVYIGGGFGKGIHNILEPTIFGKSVIFGPNFKKFWEAETFIDLGISMNCNNADDFVSIIKELNEERMLQISIDLKIFYKNYPNAVEKIMKYCVNKKLIN